MILHDDDLRLLRTLLSRERARLTETARHQERLGRLDLRNEALLKLCQVERLQPIFEGTGRRIVRGYREAPGRPRKGCGKLEERMVAS